MNVAVVTISAAILATKYKVMVLDVGQARVCVENAARLHAQAIILRDKLNDGPDYDELEIQETALCPKCGAPTSRECTATACPTTK